MKKGLQLLKGTPMNVKEPEMVENNLIRRMTIHSF